ncbi:MAG: phage terminase family protein [Planctomycetia bacterium]|nr:phage terminase family protein [Planctomycetia bacterium]
MNEKQEEKLEPYSNDPLAFALDLQIVACGGVVRFGDVIADFQRERFAALAPALLAVARGEKPAIGRHWWEATKGASKDSDLAIALLWLLIFTPRPINGQIAASDKDQAAEVRKAARDLLYHNPWLMEFVKVDNWQIVNVTNGSTAEILAADVAGSHGARPDFLLINELSCITKREFAENLMDNAAKVPGGIVVVATNAGFVGTWQFRWRENARKSDRWSFHKWDKPSPWLDLEEIAEAERRNMPARFMRLWRGLWASGTGDALDTNDIAAAVKSELPPLSSPERGFAYGGGLDLGIKHDHSALVVVGVGGQQKRIRLASCQSWAPGPGGHVDLDTVESAALLAWRQFQLKFLRYDPYQCEAMAQRLRRRGVNMVEVPFVGKNQNEMATTLLDVFRSRLIDMYDEPQLVADLSRLFIVEKSYGYKLESTRDDDGHADRATGLALALLNAKQLAHETAHGFVMLPFIENSGRLPGFYRQH